VSETIQLNGSELAISFGEAEGNVFAVSITDLSINIADVVTIEGNLSFSDYELPDHSAGKSFAGSGLTIFLGQGPATMSNGDPNPLARGLLISNATLALVKDVAGANFALDARGLVSLVGFGDVQASGEIRVRVNSFQQEFDDVF